jgi:hypothetical protein
MSAISTPGQLTPVIFPLHPGGGAMFVIERPCCGRESEVSVFANMTTGMWQPYKRRRTCQMCGCLWEVIDGVFGSVEFSLREPSDG